jgi:hypothetical protein
MFHRLHAALAISALLLLTAAPRSACPQPKHEKTVWNYDGGILMVTDGSIPNGPCFRVNGKVTAGDFFENLKRVDTGSGTFFRRGNDIVTEFPERLRLSMVMYDFPCSDAIQQAGTRVYLNYNTMSSLRVGLFWKRGTDARPATGVALKHSEARQVPPYATQFTKELPEMYEWFFEFDVPSQHVPVTDSLVVVLQTADGKIAARFAARM